eukprot:CCRYP_019512-RA/>CCRYP_019512-RA protein AED:0.26 eAED:0.26 QI:0/0/0/1/0/0/2/0/562
MKARQDFKSSMSILMLLPIFLFQQPLFVFSFLPPSTRASIWRRETFSNSPPVTEVNRVPSSTVFASDRDDDTTNDIGDDDDDGGIKDFESRRMDIVRILQNTYYRSLNENEDGGNDGFEESIGNDIRSTGKTATLDETTGRVLNLPLWRVGWVETPGRRNCLNVHEGQYTHMFETILSRSSTSKGVDDGSGEGPLYFGHLYLPGGSASSRSGQEKYQLKTWKEELLSDETRFDLSLLNTYKGNDYVNDRSAVIGCLMQIVDHRRMDDGRLIILVQAVERFVVDEILETKPYAVANVQILLDEEELPWSKSANLQVVNNVVEGGNLSSDNAKRAIDENFCKYVRGSAVSASFYYHSYEFDKPKLPISDNRSVDDKSEEYISKDDIPWIGISKLLPFAHYSTDDVSLTRANEKRENAEKSLSVTSSGFDGGESTLEQQLQNGGILWNPSPIMSSDVVIRRSQDLNNCDSLETLLWLALDDFCRATRFVPPEEVLNHPKTTLSPKYPKLRRQRRLSYLAPALIENLEVGKGMRQVWLNTPSTRARLRGALERFDHLNNELMGQFN